MLDFHVLDERDKSWIDDVLDGTQYFGCFCTFATVYLWRNLYGTQVARFKNAWLMRGKEQNGRTYYMFPLGKEYDLRELIPLLRRDAAQCGTKLLMVCAEQWQCDELRAAFPHEFCYTENRSDFDYIYLTQNLMELRGKKFHAKRNHISKFMRSYPDWQYEPISADNMSECIHAASEWLERALTDADEEERLELLMENSAIAASLSQQEMLGIVGGLLRVGGKVIALTLGEPINQRVFVTHFEKANTDYEGVYAMINQQFAIHALSSYEYVNREEDLGIEGLRKAKLSYFPDILLEKFNIEDLT